MLFFETKCTACILHNKISLTLHPFMHIDVNFLKIILVISADIGLVKNSMYIILC
jgi:hypothetical protein